ncbi:MAG: hypothetical protein ACKVPJ_13620 [Chitinophagales bacterium]
MKITSISYSKVFNLGNYSNEKIGVEIEISEVDDPVACHLEAVKYVEKAHLFQQQLPKYTTALKVIKDTDNYTGFQRKDANAIIEDFEKNFSDFLKKVDVTQIPQSIEY